jgi:hypothetical protein
MILGLWKECSYVPEISDGPEIELYGSANGVIRPKQIEPEALEQAESDVL